MKKLLAAIVSAVVVASFSGVAFATANVIYMPKFGWAITTNYAGEQKEVKASHQMHGKQYKEGEKHAASSPCCACPDHDVAK